jgi:hypothetical protein
MDYHQFPIDSSEWIFMILLGELLVGGLKTILKHMSQWEG